MTHRVVIVAEAEEQLRTAIEWWHANRPSASTLLLEEFEQVVRLLEEVPGIGPRFHKAKIPGIRRILMRKSNHWVYYVTDLTHAIVYTLAIWSAFRGADPPLAGRP